MPRQVMAPRTGLVAEKAGMTRIFMDDGRSIPVTVLQVPVATVVAQRTVEKDGYVAMQLASFAVKPQRLSKPVVGHYAKAGQEPKQVLKEFRVAAENLLEVGTTLTAGHFKAGQLVDVAGTSKGRGFTGVMKRWNFAGLRATHGVSISHRSHGSTGQRQDPGKVFKGKKMAGHYGDERITTQNLEIVRVDEELGLLLIKGSVPGYTGAKVFVQDAIKGQPVPKQEVAVSKSKNPMKAAKGK